MFFFFFFFVRLNVAQFELIGSQTGLREGREVWTQKQQKEKQNFYTGRNIETYKKAKHSIF